MFLQAKRTLRQDETVQHRMLQEETDQNSLPGKMIIMLCRLGCNIP